VDARLSGKGKGEPAETTAVVKRVVAPPVAVLLRAEGTFPPRLDERGIMLDPSPLAGLTARQRRRRLVGILEVLALHGDGSAAAEALRHARWEEEMLRGKAPARADAGKTGELRVIDTLSAPPGTPIPQRRREPQSLVDARARRQEKASEA
jgi:hypothetical protein